jgi:hypothetical protein
MMLARKMVWVVLGLGLSLAATASAEGWTSGNLEDKWVKALRAIPADPLPKALSANAHFAISDERRHDLFADQIANRGGVWVGVGPEQNYLMAGWAKPEILVLLDFDQFVVDLHHVYMQAFLHASTPTEFLGLWSKGSEAKLIELVRAGISDATARERCIKVLKKSRGLVSGKLRTIINVGKKRGFESFLSSQEIYDGIRALVKQNRVVAVRGDLTGKETISSLAKVLGDMGKKIGVVYLSNAEKYFDWVPSYRDNMRSLPWGEKSLVIRTAGWAQDHSAEDDPLYMYLVQDAANFRAWLDSSIKNWSPMLGRRGPKLAQGYYRIEKSPGAK